MAAMAQKSESQRRAACQAARGAALTAHGASGLAQEVSLPAARMLRAAEGLIRSALAALSVPAAASVAPPPSASAAAPGRGAGDGPTARRKRQRVRTRQRKKEEAQQNKDEDAMEVGGAVEEPPVDTMTLWDGSVVFGDLTEFTAEAPPELQPAAASSCSASAATASGALVASAAAASAAGGNGPSGGRGESAENSEIQQMRHVAAQLRLRHAGQPEPEALEAAAQLEIAADRKAAGLAGKTSSRSGQDSGNGCCGDG